MYRKPLTRTMDYKSPPKPYKEVKSEYIKKQMRKGKLEDENHRKYIHELIWLEKCVLQDRPAGWPTGMILQKIYDKRSGEFGIIRAELKPEKAELRNARIIANAIEASLEPEETEMEHIKRRLENQSAWKQMVKAENV